MQSRSPRRPLVAALALAAALAAAGCSTLGTEPPAGPVSMAGMWLRDAARSDDFDRKLAPLIEHERQRLLPHRGLSGSGGSGGGSGGGRGGGRSRGGSDDSAGGSGADDMYTLATPPEDPGQVRTRLASDLRPAGTLRVELPGEAVEITNDAEPVRRFLPGQAISRIDSSGAASLTSGWDERAFVVRARYTNRAARNWRYELEESGEVLRLGFEANDPEFGNLVLVTRYRRAK